MNFSHISEVIRYQAQRVRKRGMFIVLSFLQLYLLVAVWPNVLIKYVGFVQSILPRCLVLFFILATHTALIMIPYNLFYYAIYNTKYAFIQKYKVSDKLWPWQQNQQKWSQLFHRTMDSNNKCMLFITLPFILLQSFLAEYIGYQTSLESMPSAITIIWQCVIILLIQDFLFYTIHRYLHEPSVYKIHKKHHQYVQTVSIASTYSHPLEYISSGLIAMTIGYKILALFCPVHIVTICVWVTFRVVQATEGHGGYEFPWSIYNTIPFGAGAKYHSFHHSHNVGNFGSFLMLWDTLNGTNLQYFKFIRKQRQNAKIKG